MTLPFEVNVADVDIGLQANLIDLQNDEMFQQDLMMGSIMFGK